ncbi:putative apoptosis-inducing TAF9-like domain 1 family protein [Geopyxis carbonaria]|nr:putative apoptosis-inducing TAF9-like domain 1 family protein [Geopyxis carbonaria]
MSTPAPETSEALQERLKATLWYQIGKLVDHESLELGVNATPQFIGALTEMVWTQLEMTARDLESFAHHANRSTITTDDVLLLARRNEGLESLLKEFVEERKEKAKAEKEEEEREDGKAAGRGRGRGRGRGKKT